MVARSVAAGPANREAPRTRAAGAAIDRRKERVRYGLGLMEDATVPDDAAALFLARSKVRLASLAAALAEAATPCALAWTLCEFAGRELTLVDVVVYLRDGDRALVQQAAWGPKRAAEHVLESRIRLAIGQGVVGSCAKLLKPQRVADTRRDPRYVVDDQTNLSELAVPIVRGGVLYGVLDSEHPQAGYFDERHERVMLMFADCAAARLWALAG